jgi:hypothetical protein
MHTCEVYFLGVKIKIFESLNIYLESENLIGNIWHLNPNFRKMLFCRTKVELSVTYCTFVLVLLLRKKALCSFHKHTMMLIFSYTLLLIDVFKQLTQEHKVTY